MTRIGLPVPPGFTITTEVCSYFTIIIASYPTQLEAQVATAMAKVEKSTGKRFGDQERPLLVSVRSGARDSMPGMMDTILNLGMNDEVVEIVAKKTKNKRFAWDSYRRFLPDVWRRGDGRAKTAGGRPRAVRSSDRALEGRTLREARLPRCAIDRR